MKFKHEVKGSVRVYVKLQLADKNWKSNISKQQEKRSQLAQQEGGEKHSRNPVGGMVGIYILRYVDGKCGLQDVVQRSTFVPTLHQSFDFEVKEPVDPRGFIIMPATYESKLKGKFILAVRCEIPFTLTDAVQ